jgi:hypothetical protein
LTTKQNQGVGTEFENYLTTSAAGSAGSVAFGCNGDCLDPHASSFGGNGGKDGVALGADGETVRCVLHVATGVLGPTLGEDGGAYLEIRIGGVRVLEGSAGGSENLFLLVGSKVYGHNHPLFELMWQVWGGHSLSAALEFGFDLSFDRRGSKIKFKFKFKSGGQECPPHT